jgi:hypothetical protein
MPSPRRNATSLMQWSDVTQRVIHPRTAAPMVGRRRIGLADRYQPGMLDPTWVFAAPPVGVPPDRGCRGEVPPMMRGPPVLRRSSRQGARGYGPDIGASGKGCPTIGRQRLVTEPVTLEPE